MPVHPQCFEDYVTQGCGRCDLGATPECKVHSWEAILRDLRATVIAAGLTEEIKWSMPSFSWKGTNLVMVVAFRDYAAVSFLRGTLLSDPEGVLVSPGPNSQAVRYLRYESPEDVVRLQPALDAFLKETIAKAEAGEKVAFKGIDEHEVPEELARRLEVDLELANAFERLTPGRKRGYYLQIGGAKQAQTREARIDKWRGQILAGKGIHD